MLKCLMSLELDGTTEIPMFNGCATIEASVHEALCKAIHELDISALTWLSNYTTDIKVEQTIAV